MSIIKGKQLREWPRDLFKTFDRWEALGSVNMPDGARLIGHVPHIAPLAYLHRIPAPLSDAGFASLSETVGIILPIEIREFYACANGLSAFSSQIEIYGVRQNYGRADLLAASAQPFSVETPNRFERPSGMMRSQAVVASYRDGSRIIVDEGNVLTRCARENAQKVFEVWPGFRAWLTSEIARLDAFFDDGGKQRRV